MAVLIGRKLDHKILGSAFEFLTSVSSLFSFQGAERALHKRYAPLAQLVEHLTLNQGVPGSSP